MFIKYPGVITTRELTQAIWEDIKVLEEQDGVEFVKNGKLYLPVCNKYGDPKVLLKDTGEPLKYFTSWAYKSAAWDYDL